MQKRTLCNIRMSSVVKTGIDVNMELQHMLSSTPLTLTSTLPSQIKYSTEYYYSVLSFIWEDRAEDRG